MCHVGNLSGGRAFDAPPGINESINNFRIVFGYRNAGVLRAGTPQPLVYSCFCPVLRIGIDLRVSSGGLAIRLR